MCRSDGAVLERLLKCAALASAGAALGCGDPFGADSKIQLDLVVSYPQMVITTGPDDWPQANCNYTITATAKGMGEAVWGDVKARWYMGVDRAAPVDSETVSASEMVAAWGSDRIKAGEEQAISWEIWASYPFELEMEFLYRSGGRSGSVRARRPCGRTSAATTEPVVSYVTATPSSNVEPGDAVTLGYSVGSSGGVWAMTAAFFGAFERQRVLRGELQPTVAGNLLQQVPATALLDEEAFVTVFATDAFGRTTSGTASIGPIVDNTAPELSIGAQGRFVDPISSVVDGRYFVGDTLEFTAVASDNHQIERILWETSSGQRDSASIGDSATIFRGRVGFSSDWASGFQLRVTARDRRGLAMSDTVTGGAALQVYPSIQRPTVSALLGGGAIRDIEYDLSRDRAYVLISDGCCDSRLALVTLSTLTEVFSIPMRGVVLGRMDVTASGDSLLIPAFSQGNVFVVNLRQVLQPIPMAIPGGFPWSIAISANGKAFMAQGGGPGAAIIELDLATGGVRSRPDAAGTDAVVDITRSHDHNVIAVVRTTCAHLYDLASDTFSSCLPIQRPGTPMTDLTGAHHVVGLDVYDAEFQLLRSVESIDTPGTAPVGAITVAGDHVHHFRNVVAGPLRSRVSDGALLDRTVLPFYQPHLVSMAPDGSRMLIATDGNAIAVSRLIAIDLRDESATPLSPAVFADAAASGATGSVPSSRAPGARGRPPSPSRGRMRITRTQHRPHHR